MRKLKKALKWKFKWCHYDQIYFVDRSDGNYETIFPKNKRQEEKKEMKRKRKEEEEQKSEKRVVKVRT